ncbi:MAG: peptidoglycan DD-metalloendopeptidase family protein [Patescibacteria group bacterium]|jgi:murein DD-endopeptidase MepM/ murein hydrolase activator NlpD
MNWLNKNKITNAVTYTGLTIIVASFLLLPVWRMTVQAQTADTNVPEITNTATNTNSATNENANTDQALTNTTPTTNLDDLAMTELNQALDEKRKAIEDLKKRTETYQSNIEVKQQEAVTLQNQLSLIDLQVQQAENDIETVKAEVEAVNLEIGELDAQISQRTDELTYNKKVLAEYLRAINKYDQKTYLEIFMSNGSFSEFFDQMQYTQELQGQAQSTLKSVQDAKSALDDQKSAKDEKKNELTALSDKLSASITNLASQKDYKSNLLSDTKNSEVKFTDLLEVAKKEQLAAEAEMNTLESKAREKLQDEGVDLNIDSTFIWPASPTKGISAYFHDPTYIFKKYFQHPAIDIPTAQGTAIRAADNGYVVRAKNAGMGYSYVMLVHNNQLSTVYGHMSRIDVSEDSYVVRGQQIGLSGGTPGTTGAGSFTTGPHLHFEVRSNGIPVNPLDYLPAR